MTAKTAYRRYPEIVKSEVARTNNIYLFPDLKIPRTTAQYWLTKKKYLRRPTVENIDSIYKRKAEYLLAELEKEKALRTLLETVRMVFPFDFREKNLKSKLSREKLFPLFEVV